jgi:CubicO group peptidase (beta-lactamase class C family)
VAVKRGDVVLGRLVEVVSGKKLSVFLAERILTPLGMPDTAFYVTADKLARAAQPWQRPNAPAMTPRFDVAEKPAFESGGGGITSTMHDYLRSPPCWRTAANSMACTSSAKGRSRS